MQTIRFHYRGLPITIKRRKADPERNEKDLALLWYATHLLREGALARYVLRKYAGGAQ